ncbi:MAG: TIGR03557 family F420-dependent LLM class oxidoreductase [Dehalococcoidia bacterium]
MERSIGYVLAHEQFSPGDLVEFAVAAEEAGFEGLWASDHFHPWQENQGHCGQAWITLAAMGQRTARARLGTGVTCPIYRYHPAVVAQAFATLGSLYPGRVFLGLGTGEAVNELPGGGAWGPYRERHARLREAITLIRRLLTGEWVSSEGPAFPIPDAKLYTKPAEPVPIYVAASGPRSAALAGELGDGWIVNAAEVPAAAKVAEAYEAGLAAGGRPGERPPLLVEMYAVVGDEAEALEAARPWQFGPAMGKLIDESDPRVIQRRAEELSPLEAVIKPWIISRDPSVHVEGIERLFEQGATDVYVHSPQEDQRKVIEFYGREVLPKIGG